jgi:hypothetical protein
MAFCDGYSWSTHPNLKENKFRVLTALIHVSRREHFYPNCYISDQGVNILQVCSDILILRVWFVLADAKTSEAASELSKQEKAMAFNFTSNTKDYQLLSSYYVQCAKQALNLPDYRETDVTIILIVHMRKWTQETKKLFQGHSANDLARPGYEPTFVSSRVRTLPVRIRL